MKKTKYLITGSILLTLTPQLATALTTDVKNQSKAEQVLNAPIVVPGVTPLTNPTVQSSNMALNILLERAQYWQSLGDFDRAGIAWGKLLNADPNNMDAIFGMGVMAVSNKQIGLANNYLDQLKKINSASSLVLTLEQFIRMTNPEAAKALLKARISVESGERNESVSDFDEAIKSFDVALGGLEPHGAIGVEYYTALHLTSVKDAPTVARVGLERLMKESPNDVTVQIALARLLVRFEPSRAEGIKLCFKLLDNDLVKGFAALYARAALEWIKVPEPKYFELFETFLKKYPDDKDIRDQLNSGIQKAKLSLAANKPNANGAATPVLSPKVILAKSIALKGDEFLKKGDVTAAISSYEASLKSDNNDPWIRLKLANLYLKNDQVKAANELMYSLPYSKTNQADILFARAIYSNASQDWKRALADVNLIPLTDRTKAIDSFRAELLLREKVERFIVLVKQKKSTEANSLFSQIMPDIGHNLALASMVANTLIVDGQVNKGLELFQKAIKIDAEASNEVLLSYADLLLVAKQNVELAKLLDQFDRKKLSNVEHQHLDDIQFNFQLLNTQMLFENKQIAAAEQSLAVLLANNAKHPGVRSLSARLYANKADILLKAGDEKAAKMALEQSLTFEPNSPWVTLKLARLLSRMGQNNTAQNLVYALEKVEPKTIDNFYVRGLFAYEMQDWKQVTKVLDQVPVKQLSAEVKTLARSARIREQLDLSNNLLQQGRKAEAVSVLANIQPLIDDSIDMVSLVASSYIDAGQPERGISLLKEVLARSPQPSAEALMIYASLLLKAKEDVELAAVLATIEKRQLSEIDKDKFEDLLAIYSVRQADILTEKGNYTGAEQRLNALLLSRPNDVMVNTSMARVYTAMGENKKALDLFKVLLESEPKSVPLLMASAGVATTLNDYDYADKCLVSATNLSPNNAEVLTSAGRLYLSQGKKVKAKQYFEEALALNMAPKATFSQNGVQLSNSKLASNNIPTMEGSSVPLPASTMLALNDQSASGNSFQSQAAKETQLGMIADIKTIKQDLGVEVFQSLTTRNRKGESGTGKLLDIEAPLEVRFPVGDAKANVIMTPVSLNSGSVASLTKFGSGAATNTAKQESSGLGLSMSYKLNGFKADVGVTPLGFTYSNFTGGLKLEGKFLEANPINYMLNVSSRPVTDSLLSFAGTTDRWGKSWGGVMASGARLQLTKDLGGYGFYGAVSYHSLNGHDVASNNRTQVEFGNYWEVLARPDYSLKTGLYAQSSSYKNNLSAFTYGNGGYFSPQEYYSIALPLTWSERTKNTSYLLSAGLSYNKIKQDAFYDFPNQPASITNTLNPGQSSSGLGYNVAALMQYKVNPHILVDANLSLESTSSGGYRQVGAGVHLTYKFEAMNKEMDLLLRPIVSTYGQQ